MNLNLDIYFQAEMQVRDEMAEEVIKEVGKIYGSSIEISAAIRLATLKALLHGPRRIMERRQQNG
jgi:hypothetical protein